MGLLKGTVSRSVRAWAAVLAAVWLVSAGPAGAQGPMRPVEEYQLKAVFLYNFAKFVEWPAQANGSKDPLVMVVFGRDPFGPALEQVVWGKTINNRPLTVRRTVRTEELLPCHVLFVSAQERRRAPEVLKVAEAAGVLTVSEMDDFLNLGGVIKFGADRAKVRFEVNLEAARRSGLKISSRLLSLARVVRN